MKQRHDGDTLRARKAAGIELPLWPGLEKLAEEAAKQVKGGSELETRSVSKNRTLGSTWEGNKEWFKETPEQAQGVGDPGPSSGPKTHQRTQGHRGEIIPPLL